SWLPDCWKYGALTHVKPACRVGSMPAGPYPICAVIEEGPAGSVTVGLYTRLWMLGLVRPAVELMVLGEESEQRFISSLVAVPFTKQSHASGALALLCGAGGEIAKSP